MADILIRGIEMPKGDNTISITIFSNGKVSLAYDKKYAEYAEAVPLPEGHGRLIDGDALDEAFTNLKFNEDGTLAHWDDRRNWCLHGEEIELLIREAPTIIPAEGGTGECSEN